MGDGTGHGDSGGSSGIVLYDEVDVADCVGVLAGSGVGRKDRGDQGLRGDDDGPV
jgi:hypothetical protein